MATNVLHLAVFLLAFSQLISLNAVPISRTRRLLHQSRDILASEFTHQMIMEGSTKEDLIIDRMDLEQTDYPGPGANRRHTPRMSLGGG